MLSVREWVKGLLGPRWSVWLRCVRNGLPTPRFGNLRRTTPFSLAFGFDRGTPIDRVYWERFLHTNRALITGRVLEIASSTYTSTFGHGVRIAHTVDIDPRVSPTYCCDLATADVIPNRSYDVFLLPFTMNFIPSLPRALEHALRVVSPGGHILACIPCLAPLTPIAPDYWRLSPAGWKTLLGEVLPGVAVEIEGHGNCFVAMASIMGLCAEEIGPAAYTVHDPRFPVLVTLRMSKGRIPD